MRIAVCDDEDIIRDELMGLCKRYMYFNPIEFDLVGFKSGEELLMYKQPIDILFLDVQMKGMNGLETALKIREKDDSMSIIFVTGYKSFMQEGYRVKAFRYLLKPLKKEHFINVLDEAINDLKKNSKAIVGKDGCTYFLKVKDILYVERGLRNTLVRTKKCYYESIMSMSDWENLLNSGDFYRVHKTYIVNMEYVEEIGKQVVLENGEKVELSTRAEAKFKKACREYRRKNAR